MNGWMDVSLDFIHVDEKYAFFLKKYFIYISQMRTTEEEGVWKGHSSAFFSSPSSLLLRIQTLPIFLAEVGNGASSHDLPRSRNAAQPSLHSGLEGMTIISALYMYIPYITSVSPSSFLLFAMSEYVCVCVCVSLCPGRRCTSVYSMHVADSK
jgi:hypothetical protein